MTFDDIERITHLESYKDFIPNKQWINTIKRKSNNCMLCDSRPIYRIIQAGSTQGESGGRVGRWQIKSSDIAGELTVMTEGHYHDIIII